MTWHGIRHTQHTPFRTYQHNHPESWATRLELFQIWLDGRGVSADEQKRGLLSDTLDDTTIRNLKNDSTGNASYNELKLDAKITPSTGLCNISSGSIVPSSLVNPEQTSWPASRS